MDSRTELRDFLTSRRAKVAPEQAGVPLLPYAGSRRVPGLRREEVAMLAGVSVDYYTRLERGNARGASDAVLNAIARALGLDEAERAHLFDLARALGTPTTLPAAPRRTKNQVRPALQGLLDAMTMAPAYISNARLDVLAANQLGRAVYAPLFTETIRPPNIARFIYLNPAAADFYDDWDRTAHDAVAMLRTEAGRNPRDKALSALIGELATQSEAFRTRWATHDVRRHCTGVKLLRHPVVGHIRLGFEAMDLPADHDLTLFAYSAKPDTPDHDALKFLASWAATHEQTQDAAEPPLRDSSDTR